MTIHDWLLACDDRFQRDWSVWVCMTGNCFRLSPLTCIFCYTPLTPHDQLLRRCPLTYPRNHVHRMPGGGIHHSIRAWWLLTRDVLLCSHCCDSNPYFFFCRPALIKESSGILSTSYTHPDTTTIFGWCPEPFEVPKCRVYVMSVLRGFVPSVNSFALTVIGASSPCAIAPSIPVPNRMALRLIFEVETPAWPSFILLSIDVICLASSGLPYPSTCGPARPGISCNELCVIMRKTLSFFPGHGTLSRLCLPLSFPSLTKGSYSHRLSFYPSWRRARYPSWSTSRTSLLLGMTRPLPMSFLRSTSQRLPRLLCHLPSVHPQRNTQTQLCLHL